MNPLFLTLAEALEIHLDQIKHYGGDNSMRDLGLLQSALAQPEASFGGEWLHADIFYMAAAYTYHICKNHPFIDGNKRTALACGLVFLELNGITIQDPKQKLRDAMWKMANSEYKKNDFAKLLKSLSEK